MLPSPSAITRTRNEDQRDQLIDTLSTYVPTVTSIQADGSTLVTLDGQALVNDTVSYHLASPVVGTNANGTPALQVDFVTPPNPVTPPAINITGGQLGGLLDTYNNKLLTYGNQLNDFANGLATESDRISQAGYDITGQPGAQLFSPVVTQLPISAGNIQVGIQTASEVPAALASTAAGTLVTPVNAANSTVDTTAAIINNQTVANPPAAQVNGTLTINVDGINPTAMPPGITVAYQIGGTVPAGTIDATSIGSFINGFNAGKYGVTASFDSTSQTIVFTRDPTNIDLTHRAQMQASVPAGTTTPDFTITDSNITNAGAPPVPPATPALGTPATALLTALGAQQINGIDQNGTNAFGSTSGANVAALATLFTASFGVPSLQTTAGNAAATAVGSVTTTGNNPAFATSNVGDVLTIDVGTANQENVTITAVNRNNGTVTFTAAKTHGVNFTITSAQTATLQQSYANLVAKMGGDTAAATTGNASQTTLATNVNAVRQSTDGINIDEETQNLVKFQNAYGAAAHVISVLSAMLDDAINLGSGSTF